MRTPPLFSFFSSRVCVLAVRFAHFFWPWAKFFGREKTRGGNARHRPLIVIRFWPLALNFGRENHPTFGPDFGPENPPKTHGQNSAKSVQNRFKITPKIMRFGTVKTLGKSKIEKIENRLAVARIASHSRVRGIGKGSIGGSVLGEDMGGKTQTQMAGAVVVGSTPTLTTVAECANAPTDEMNPVLKEHLNTVYGGPLPEIKALARRYGVKVGGKKSAVQDRVEAAIKAAHHEELGTAFNAVLMQSEKPFILASEDHKTTPENLQQVEAIQHLKVALTKLNGEGFDNLRKQIEQTIKDNKTKAYTANEKRVDSIQMVNFGGLLNEKISDALVWDLMRHITNQSRAAKPLPGARKLPQYNNAKRIGAAVTTSYNYQRKGSQRKSKYWVPINLPIVDVLSWTFHTDNRGRQGYGTDAVKVARIEPRVNDFTLGRAKLGRGAKGNHRTDGRIIRTVIETGADYTPKMVWAFAPCPIGWDLAQLDAHLAQWGLN